MSRRDIARIKFIQNFRRQQRIKNSFKLSIIDELEKLKDVEEGVASEKKMTYMELVEHINKDIKALEYQDKPITLYKDE